LNIYLGGKIPIFNKFSEDKPIIPSMKYLKPKSNRYPYNRADIGLLAELFSWVVNRVIWAVKKLFRQ
jgi:hypothetical protein